MCGGVIRLKCNGTLECCYGLVMIAVVVERVAEIVMQLPDVGSESDGLSVATDGLFKPAKCLERIAEVIVGRRVTRLEVDGI